MMDLSDFKSLRRWSDLPRKFSHLSRMAYMVFLAITGLFLVTLSWVMLQQPTVASTTSSSSSIDYANGKVPAAVPTVIHTPVPTPELSSVTIHHSDEGTSHVDHSATPLIKPDGMRIVGVIFYGRRDRASLLECYLRKNLVSYGGWLDEVIWAANTDDADDLAYGEHIAATQNEYTYLPISSTDDQGEGYMNIYRNAFKEPDTIYVKMDDDVVFIDQSAIPRVVMTLLNNPRALLVSANVVNNPALGWVHYHMGAVHPYVPEVRPDGDNLASKENGAWRSSELPTWSGAEWEMPELDHFYSLFGVNDKTNVPLHRWIPTRNLSLLHKTPVAKSEYNAFGNNLHFWPLAAQAHYSLLQNIEEKRLGRYFMVHGSDEEAVSTWDMNGSRISINFMVIKGKDIIDNISNLQPDDENKLTVELPTLLNRAVLVETTSVVSHFSFGPQKNLAKTDILARYHNYANQNICPNAILEPEVLLTTDKMPGAVA